MAFGFTLLTSGSDDSGGSDITTASVSPAGNALILAFIDSVRGAGAGIPSVSGNGLTWVQVDTNQWSGGDYRATVFRAMGASPSSGVITIDTNPDSDAFAWQIIEVTGVDTSGTNGSGAIAQSVDSSGSSSTGASITLAAFSDANNGTMGFFEAEEFNSGTAYISPGSGFTELGESGRGSFGVMQESEYRTDNDTGVDVSWSGLGTLNWGGVAIEIVLASAGGTGKSNPLWGPLGGPLVGAIG